MNEITKISDKGFVTISKEQLAKINARLPEFHRASALIGHSTSQASYSLQTMNMLSDSPLSRMKQCLAQISKKYSALSEAYYNIENKKLEIMDLTEKTDKKSRLKVRELDSQVGMITRNMENALRQIGMFQDMYDSIKKNNNIPDDWSEKDYEQQEIENMIRKSFRLGIQDLTASDRISRACVEYWEQLGIHPQYAETITRGYMESVNQLIRGNQKISIKRMFDFLDEMALEFKDSYKDALNRMGLDELGSEGFMAEGVTKPQ